MSFWGELKRRNVFKIGVAYVIVAWLIIQAVATIFPVLQLPEWAVTLVTSLLIIGFPIALLLAWAYEVTPEGIKRTKEVPLSKSIRHLTGQKLMYVVVALLVIAVAFLIIDNYILEREIIEPESVTTEPEQMPVVSDVEEAPKTIAVIPFVNLSPDPNQEYFVDGLSEELLNCLSKIAGLSVTSRTSSFLYKDSDKSIQEIAGVLGVDHILEGSVRKAGNALRITAQLIRAKDDFHLWSETYDRELKDIFEVQEDIATAVADELKETLQIGSLKQLGGTDNTAAYELYLVARGQLIDFEMDRALGSIDAALLLDPEFALAYALKSYIHNGLAYAGSDSRIAAELDAGLQAAQKAIELEPNLAEAHLALGIVRTSEAKWIEAETAYQKALELTTDPSSRHELELAAQYISVGYFEKAKGILEARIRTESNRLWYSQYIELLFAFFGDRQKAEEENKIAKELFGDEWRDDIIMFSLRLGSGDIVPRDEWPKEVSVEFDALGIDLESPEQSLAVYRQIYVNMGDKVPIASLMGISMLAAYFDDPDFAMELIEKVGIQRVDAISNLWYPVMKEVRQLPRFKEFVKEIGLVDYWNEFGWPDLCRPVGDDDFKCD